MDVFLARQPIFDRNQTVVAYELLYRSSAVNRATIENPDVATLEVFTNTFMDIGLEAVTGRRRAYINLTRHFLLGHYPIPSMLDAFIDKPIHEIIAPLSLADDVFRGIAQRKGPIGQVLALVLHAQRGEWDQMDRREFSAVQINDAMLQSIIWAEDALQLLQD